MNLWSEIEAGSDVPDVVTAVIEVPKGLMSFFFFNTN